MHMHAHLGSVLTCGALTVLPAAAQLATGWGVWKELGSRKADYNLRFATGGAQALQAALGPAEALDFKCVFSAALGDDWGHYLRTCAAGAPFKLVPPPPPPPPPASSPPRQGYVAMRVFSVELATSGRAVCSLARPVRPCCQALRKLL